ncbi:MAG TPA: ABC transporter ATP-binding protein, partial [Pseudonocardiaceae bacterium]|nr:ABC transporter ATP-binding protein [Pseudonocardiaceae bacterium]
VRRRTSMSRPISQHPQQRHWQVLLTVLRQRRGMLLRLAGWSVVEAVPAFLSGRLVATAIDDGFLAGRPAAGFGSLAIMALSVLVGAVGTRQTFLRLAAIVEPFRDELVDLVVTGVLRRSTLTDRPSDTAGVARLTHQVEIVRESFASVIMVVQSFLITTTSALLGLFTLAPLALAFVLPPLLVGLALFVGSLRAMATWQRTAILADERIAETINMLAGGLRDIIACGAEDQIRTTATQTIDAQENASTTLARVTAMRTTALGISAWLPLLLILLGTPWLISHGATTGTVLGTLTYVSLGLQPALQTLIRTVGGTGLWLLVTLARITEAAQLPAAHPTTPTSRRTQQPPRPAPRSCDHVLELRDVTFSYGRHAEPVIHDLDLLLAHDDHLAVVGPSGIGKSTLAAIIAGLLTPQTGQVLLDGVALGDWETPHLTQRRVLIPQQAYVFTGTVAENLNYYLHGEPTPTQLDEAVNALGARMLIERLGGYQADLHPAALSAGERQLLTLVRAYLSPARLVILDEATCHLDPAAEAQAELAFTKRPGALLVIAHRTSSALRARKILLLNGRHALLGNHQDLLTRSPLYRDLVGHWHSTDLPRPRLTPAAGHDLHGGRIANDWAQSSRE